MNDPNELSEAERRAFEALARERSPRSELEDRVVAALRRQGLLPIPLARSAVGGGRRLAPWLWGAAAASVLLFAGGFAAGQYVGSRSGAAAVLSGVQASRGSAADVAAHAERAGSMYVAALTALSQLSDTADAATRAGARRAAMAALGAAASEVAHLAPDDPLAAAVLRGLNDRSREQGPAPSTRSVVWF